jgi:ABC-type multidrug transport system ATPase subunit
VIEVIDLTVRRRNRLVLDEVGFDIRPGQVTGLLGVPGSGKTALVRQLVRLDRGRGRVLFDGVPYRALRHPSREVGLLLDPEIGDPRRTVRGQLRLLLAADRRAALATTDPGVRRRERATRRIDEVLGVVGLREQSEWRLAELTDEMATRLALGAALLADPKTLVLDDPGRGLEPEGLAWLGALLRAFTSQGRAALITGSQTEAMVAMADRILLLDAGQLVGVRTAEEVLRAPAGAVVVVRSPQIVRFAGILAEVGVRTAMGEGACLEVRGLDRSGVGDLAYRHGVPVHELAERFTGREPADLVLAGCSAQYRNAQFGAGRFGLGPLRPDRSGSVLDGPARYLVDQPESVRLGSVPEQAPQPVAAKSGGWRAGAKAAAATPVAAAPASAPATSSAPAPAPPPPPASVTASSRPLFGSARLRRSVSVVSPGGGNGQGPEAWDENAGDDGVLDWPESVRLVPAPQPVPKPDPAPDLSDSSTLTGEPSQ